MDALEAQGLLPYCQTDTQRAHIYAWSKHGTQAKAAKAMGVSKRCFEETIARVRKNAGIHGYSPEHGLSRGSPAGMLAQGISRFDKEEGAWYKYRIDPAAQEDLQKALLDGLRDQIPKPRLIKRFASAPSDPNVLNQFLLTDYHLGQYSWHEETGADWDLKIAERTMLAFFEEAIRRAPAAHTALFAQLGDFFHFDSRRPETPTHKHLLDADTRFPLMLRTGMRLIRQCVEMLLAHYEHVHLLLAEGNHDLDLSVVLREHMNVLCESNPRVTVETDSNPYYAHRWGDCGLFYHHGHLRNHKRDKKGQVADNSVVQTWVAKFPRIFGETKYRYGHLGHLHHHDERGTNLMRVTQHPTLAAPDAHSASLGHISERNASVTSYDKRYGQIAKHDITPEMLNVA